MQLSEAIAFWQALPPEDPLKRHLRSAVIQSFDFSYELSVRVARRVLVERAESADLLRRALDAGLPMPLDAWRRWRDMRNGTSCAYDEERAQSVATQAATFAADARSLLKHLTELGA